MSGYWDIHNHILPGVDDGACCFDETLELIEAEYEQGVRSIVFTPHYRKGMFEVSEKDRIAVYNDTLNKLQEICLERMFGLRLFLGCELHMHPDPKKLIANRCYCMPGKNIVLTEFSNRDNYWFISDRLSAMTDRGYRCIVAHVERYGLCEAEIKELHNMKGVYLQLNASSILGREGLKKMILARKILAKGYIDIVASDAHNMRERPVEIKTCADWIYRKCGEKMLNQVLFKNPEILFGKERANIKLTKEGVNYEIN